MKIWWFATFYWFSLLIYLNVFMFNFHYADGSSTRKRKKTQNDSTVWL